MSKYIQKGILVVYNSYYTYEETNNHVLTAEQIPSPHIPQGWVYLNRHGLNMHCLYLNRNHPNATSLIFQKKVEEKALKWTREELRIFDLEFTEIMLSD